MAMRVPKPLYVATGDVCMGGEGSDKRSKRELARASLLSGGERVSKGRQRSDRDE